MFICKVKLKERVVFVKNDTVLIRHIKVNESICS
jgi:hypothetical protein